MGPNYCIFFNHLFFNRTWSDISAATSFATFSERSQTPRVTLTTGLLADMRLFVFLLPLLLFFFQKKMFFTHTHTHTHTHTFIHSHTFTHTHTHTHTHSGSTAKHVPRYRAADPTTLTPSTRPRRWSRAFWAICRSGSTTRTPSSSRCVV